MSIDKRKRTKSNDAAPPKRRRRATRPTTVIGQADKHGRRRPPAASETEQPERPRVSYSLMCYGDIMPELAAEIRQELAAAKSAIEEMGAELGELHVYINSPGGLLDAGLDIYDQLLAMPVCIVTHAFGQVASAAALVFSAGDRRMIAPNATLMLHNGSVGLDGMVTERELSHIAAEMKLAQFNYNAIIAGRCGLSIEIVNAWCDAEKRFTAAEAVALNLADGIEANVDRAKFRG